MRVAGDGGCLTRAGAVMNTEIIAATEPKKSLVEKFASRFGVEPGKFMDAIKATAFKQRDGSAPSNEQMMALLVVADQYGLNPWTKEIYAFPDKHSGIIPIVGVDGWSRIINSDSAFDGMEFNYSSNDIDSLPGQKHPAPEWCECIIYRKDRARPITVREYLDEVYQPPRKGYDGPWQTHTRRFLRHKTMIQCARLAFGFVGIYDQDEAERIINAEVVDTPTEYLSHTNEQKETFDRFIEDEDSLGLFCQMKGLSPSVQASLYNSFPKGQKTKMKEVVRKMEEEGGAAFEDLLATIVSCNHDEIGLLEIINELTPAEYNLVLKRVTPEIKASIDHALDQSSPPCEES